MTLPPAPLFAVADAARIDQVLTNLVVNSIRYTEAGEVRVSMETLGEPPKSLRFVVADGPGIPENVLPTLFEPDRIATTPARRGEGSGIGLAIVRTLVEHLGGICCIATASADSCGLAPLSPLAADEVREHAEAGVHHDLRDARHQRVQHLRR